MIDLSDDALRARVLHRDGLVIVLDKPAGVAVHGGPGAAGDLESRFDALRYGLPRPPALAHRLDRDTSGCLVLGRHRKALARLGKLFQRGEVAKLYWAVVLGGPRADEGLIEAPLVRRSHERRSWWMRVAAPGEPGAEAAATRWRVAGRGDGLAWLALEPLTGRTHQLRVHLAHLGHPIAGDRLYGGDAALAAAARMHLHARRVAFAMKPGAAPLVVTAPVPAHAGDLLAACGWPGEAPAPGEAPSPGEATSPGGAPEGAA